ncbi:MAG: hypothetical protein PVF43_13175, partial [Candidatus Eiseniibacteriota bacterium]
PAVALRDAATRPGAAPPSSASPPSSAAVPPDPTAAGPRVARAALAIGERRPGPLVVTEPTATTWVPPDWSLQVAATGALLLRRGER